MASNAAMIARNIRLWRDANLSPEQASKVLAVIARQRRDALIASGQAAPTYTTFVDGQLNVPEEQVRADGVILYKFNQLPGAVLFGMGFVLAASPVEEGVFRRSWFVAVNNRAWTAPLNEIPPDAEVTITNPTDYARKIEVGHTQMRVPHGICQHAAQAIGSKFPSLQAETRFIDIPAEMGGGYVLRGRFRKGVRPHARTSLRRDTREGEPMTYPAVVFSNRL